MRTGRHDRRRLGDRAVTVAELLARAWATGRPTRLAWGAELAPAGDEYATAVLPTVEDVPPWPAHHIE